MITVVIYFLLKTQNSDEAVTYRTILNYSWFLALRRRLIPKTAFSEKLQFEKNQFS